MERSLIVLFILIAASIGVARADDFGMSIKDFPDRLTNQFRTLGDSKPPRLVLDNCQSEKRTVCTYKIGDYMFAMAAGLPPADQLSDLTLICQATTDLGGLRCVNAYATAIALVLPDSSADDRGKIVKALFGGLDAGDSIQVKKDDKRFILQRVAGSLWFSIEADEST